MRQKGNTGNLMNVRSRREGNVAVIYAGDYLNKLSGERIERECQNQLDAGCQSLILSFKETQLVNSIGVSILLGVLDAAEKVGATLIFSDLNEANNKLFDMLGLSLHVKVMNDEQAAISALQPATIQNHA